MDFKATGEPAPGASIDQAGRRSAPITEASVLLEIAPDPMVIVGFDGLIAVSNAQLLRMFGYERDEVVGRPIEMLVPERFRNSHFGHRQAYFGEPRTRPMGAGLELFARRKDGTEFPVEISLAPLRTGGEVAVAAAIRDVSDRKLVEVRLRASLREKEVLLKEIHHRVKNNLQIVTSMLNLQMRQLTDPHAVELFKQTQSRVRSIALFHEKLYQFRDLARVDIAGYLDGLARSLLTAYGVLSEEVTVTVDAEDVPLGVDGAISSGLIVNELLSNAIKHAFPRGRSGKIVISLHRDQENVVLEVRDDGVGIPPEVDLSNARSLGLKLVSIFTEQLQGTLTLDRTAGTRVSVRFRPESRS